MIAAIRQIDGHESMTTAEIADTLQASGVTAYPINRAALMDLLNKRGMLRKIVSNNDNEKWTGTVLNMQDAILAIGSDDQKSAIRLWFSHITNVTNVTWDTTDAIFAAAFWQMRLVFADQLGMPTAADFEAVASLGGGWRFGDITGDQVLIAITASAADEYALQLVQRLESAIRLAADQSDATPDTILAAARLEIE